MPIFLTSCLCTRGAPAALIALARRGRGAASEPFPREEGCKTDENVAALCGELKRVAVRREVLGKRHPDTAVTLNPVGH